MNKFDRNFIKSWSNAWKKENVGNTISTIGAGLTGIANAGIQNSQIKDTSEEEALLQDIENTTFSSSTFDNVLEQFDSNSLARTNYNSFELRNLDTKGAFLNTLGGMASGAMSGAQIGGIYGGIAGGVLGLGSGIAGIFTGNKKAREKADYLNKQATAVNTSYLNNFSNSVENIQNTMFNNSLLNLAAYGGPLNEFSGDYNNGIVFIDEGGTHEQNPLGGVPMGVDNEGTPNLVEEGEVVWQDYVFSNRLKPTNKQLADGGFKNKYQDWTFAKIVEDLQKESAETANDFISQNTLEDNLNSIIAMQEEIRAKKAPKQNVFDIGGDTTGIVQQYINGLPWWQKLSFTPEYKEVSKEVKDIINPEESEENISNNPNKIHPLRFAPSLINAGIALHNITEQPDYSGAERIEQAARNIPGGAFTPLGDYVYFQPLDRNYYLNPLLGTSRNTARAIQNQAVNSGQAIAGLLSNQYNTNLGVGEALTQMERENMARRMQSAEFNRGTNQTNSQMGLQALAMDQQKAGNILNAVSQGVNMRAAIDNMRSQAISQSLTNLGDDLGGIGREVTDRNMLQGLLDSDVLKWIKSNNKKCGGMLTRKK